MYISSIGEITNDVITELDRAILRLQAQLIAKGSQRIEEVRKELRAQAQVAINLDELRDSKGSMFVMPGQRNSDGYMEATSQNQEKAYRCPSGCGWVKGAPEKQPYDDFHGGTCGSSGVEYSCVICQQKIGRKVLVQS
ncbi:MAG: hypothetical protein WCV50_06550 [Patescibacteria group bacterium]|jgi:hypothetical protein